MKTTNVIKSYLARVPLGATIFYLLMVAIFLVTTSLAILDVLQRRQAVAETGDLLSRLEGRNFRPSRVANAVDFSLVTGSPFLEGPTVTVAGATLLQRTAGAITRFGGIILSSQVELRGGQSKDGFVSVSVECEADQSSLQKILYDLEAGMPYLFVNQLVAQAAEPEMGTLNGKLHISILVSGQWQGAK
jgi:general secretion pathway protein M